MATMSWDEAMQHVGELMPEGTRAKAMDVIQHYIWVSGKHGAKHGYCTNCLQWASAEGARHKQNGVCSRCGRRIQYRELRYKRKSLFERVFLIEYRKSLLEKDTVVCVGYDIEAQWDALSEFRMAIGVDQLPVKVITSEVCVIRYGNGGARFVRSYYSSHCERKDIFFRMRECRSGYKPDYNYQVMRDPVAFKRAIDGTSFQRVLSLPRLEKQYGTALDYDMINVLDRIAAYPTLEYIFKMGYENLGNAVIARAAGNLIKKHGKGPRDVLKLTAEQWSEIRGKKMDVTYTMLKMVKLCKELHLDLPLERYESLHRTIEGSYTWDGDRSERAFSVIAKRYPSADLKGILLYCDRRKVRMSDYYDYLGQLKTLEMDMGNEEYIYPKDFQEMHAELSRRVKIKASKLQAAQLKKFVATLKRYEFRSNGLVLRPFKDPAEVIKEGTTLHHCVGSYADRYSRGETILCCLRRETEPNKPLYTVEFTPAGKLVQCRGDHNKTAIEDEQVLKAFWLTFERHMKRYAKKAERKTA